MKGLRIATIILLILQILACIGLTFWAFIYGSETAGNEAQNAAQTGANNGSIIGGAVAGGAVGVTIMILYVILGFIFIALGVVTLIALIIYLIKKHPSLGGAIIALLIVNPIIGILMIIENMKAKALPNDINY